jgi:hypothetical protein
MKKAPKFKISEYHLEKAGQLGVTINYSKNKLKKLDVFKNGKKIASIGATGYWDYISYLKAETQGYFPKGHAERRRKLYKIRHEKEKNQSVNTAGFLAYKILW